MRRARVSTPHVQSVGRTLLSAAFDFRVLSRDQLEGASASAAEAAA
jgi:hypothetical protein